MSSAWGRRFWLAADRHRGCWLPGAWCMLARMSHDIAQDICDAHLLVTDDEMTSKSCSICRHSYTLQCADMRHVTTRLQAAFRCVSQDQKPATAPWLVALLLRFRMWGARSCLRCMFRGLA